MDFDLVVVIFLCVLFSKWWWLIPVFLFCLLIKRNFWDNPRNEIIYSEKLKNEKEYEEKKKKEQLRLEEKEILEKTHPELRLSRDLREREARRLAFHERTGHITEPEKELLKLLKASLI